MAYVILRFDCPAQFRLNIRKILGLHYVLANRQLCFSQAHRLEALHHVKCKDQTALITRSWGDANKYDGANEIWKNKGNHAQQGLLCLSHGPSNGQQVCMSLTINSRHELISDDDHCTKRNG
jgi:hypothetical protein